MAFPITGGKAKITSVTAGSMAQILTNCRISEFSIEIENDEFDISELEGSGSQYSYRRILGLRSGTASFSGFFPKTTPLTTGNFTGGVGSFIQDWKLDADWGEQEITSFGCSTKRFMPNGLFEWSGSYTAHVTDSGMVLGDDVGASTRSLVMTGGGCILTGNAYITGSSASVRKADKIAISYNFKGSGDIAETGTAMLGSTWTQSQAWDTSGTDGVPDNEIKFQLWSGPVEFTSKCFFKSLSLEAAIGQPVKVSGQLRLMESFA